MYCINYTGLKKRNTYDEIVNVIENDKTKIKYPDRRASTYLNDPHVLSITAATDIEVNEQQEAMTKHAIIENIIKQMSGNTNTHTAYNNYVHMPKQEAEAAADVDIDAKLEKQQEAAEEAVHAHRVRQM